MRAASLRHGQVFETNIPSYSEGGHGFEKIVLWCTNRSGRDETGKRVGALTSEESEAVAFMELCLDCDPHRRITAEEALQHPFVADAGVGSEEDDVVDLVTG